jgi:cytosine/adenosine deaminase-related metal-dependent hydrolase
MILKNVYTEDNRNSNAITVAVPGYAADFSIDFDNAIAFPGLINSHDHLEMNCFPPLKNNDYTNYTQWGADIHVAHKETIRSVLRIPEALRIQWGAYKNLLNGITTVVNHGKKIQADNLPVTVFQNCSNLHSVALEKNWKHKLQLGLFSKKPFVIHIGEGTDEAAVAEIDTYVKHNFFCKKTIGVHGVAMNVQQAKKFTALVWCPASNYFLLETTARIDILKTATRILFGTDSTLSAGWSVWEQLQLARSLNMLSDKELFAAVTTTAAKIWNIHNNDIVLAKKKTGNYFDGFFSLSAEDILLVIKDGQIVLYDESLHNQLHNNSSNRNWDKIFINQQRKLVQGNLADLVKQIQLIDPAIKFPFDAA